MDVCDPGYSGYVYNGNYLFMFTGTQNLWCSQVIKPGVTESRPYKGTTVVINAQGFLEDGHEVDTHDQLTFTVGDGEVSASRVH